MTGGLELAPSTAFSLERLAPTGETDLGWAVAFVRRLIVDERPGHEGRVAEIRITCKACRRTQTLILGDGRAVAPFRHTPHCRVLREVRGISSEVLRAKP